MTRLLSMVPAAIPWRPCEACRHQLGDGRWFEDCSTCSGPAPRTPAPATLAVASLVVKTITGVRTMRSDERSLQDAIGAALEGGTWTPGDPTWTTATILREERLVDEIGRSVGRVDFLIGPVALELKVAGHRSEVLRQVAGYARSPRVELLIVASTRAALLTDWPATLVGKPIVLVHLRRFP